jgi:hypothetical protein
VGFFLSIQGASPSTGERRAIENAVQFNRMKFSTKSSFGGLRWRKLKGTGLVRFPNGAVRRAELHWYEAHGVGRRKMKVKRVLD